MKLCLTKARCGAGDHQAIATLLNLAEFSVFPFPFIFVCLPLKRCPFWVLFFLDPKFPKTL